jgi:division protein CdvB (Snf7/Vps24/ESCRT-III family)
MEEQLTRIADSFERIASTLEWIQQEGIELYNKSGGLNIHIDVDDVPLSALDDFSVQLKNAKHGFKTVPFEIEQS